MGESSRETRAFEAESKQLLRLMIHSIYSGKEIFLRELVSNASDALDKLRFEALTDAALADAAGEPRIVLSVDKEARTLSVADNGIGMTRDEVVENIGTIAKSGTKELLAKLEQSGADELPEQMIGEFGVGFYSAFMVADRVELVTRRAGTQEAIRWSSSGDGTYTLEPAERPGPGTTVVLHLRPTDAEDGLEDFTEEWVIRKTVKQYSDFVRYPIVLEKPAAADAEGGEDEGEAAGEETLNSRKAIWLKAGSEVTDEEYNDFYKQLAHDWTDPIARISMTAEGRLEYRALLYVPSHAPMDLYLKSFEPGLQLYVKNVKILERCDQLLPDYLRFIRGVVDSPDLPLNVSRELLQSSRHIAQIRKALTKKVLDEIGSLARKEPEKYTELFGEFGAVLKEGVSSAPDQKEKLGGLLLFPSSADPEKLTSLDAYVERMPEGQEHIYYLTGETRSLVEQSPHLEAVRAKGYEVLFMVDPVDEFMAPALGEWKGKALKSVGKGDAPLGDDDKQIEQVKEGFAPFLEAVQKELDETVSKVRLTTRLTASAACLVGGEEALSPHIEKMLRKNKVDVPAHKRVLELNADHEIVAKLKARFDVRPNDLDLGDHARLLHGLALLAEGSAIPEPARYAKLVADLFEKSL